MTENMSDSINIKIQYFAVLQEITGCSSETLSLQVGSTPETVYQTLKDRYDLPTQKRLKIAINDCFCSWESVLTSDDTLVFIPPVTGG